MQQHSHKIFSIFVVDDDKVSRQLLITNLHLNYEIEAFDNGDSAMEAINNNHIPDLFLLDIMMPGIDGYEFCKWLKTNPKTADIPVIFITALADEEHEAKGLEAGAVDYITKPIHAALVKARIKTHLSMKMQRDSIYELLTLKTSELQKTTKEVKATNILVRDLFEAMDEMLANRDHYTFEHALRVAEISKRMGAQLGLPPEDIEHMELGCLVHDIGKVAIPDDVLLKPGRFDREDREIMELHPLIGANLFAKRMEDDKIIEIIVNHHERLDGSGYPHGLKDKEISLPVRIVMVADVFEALIAMRPYKRPMPRDKALRILKEEQLAGRVDPLMVETLQDITASWNPLEISRDFTASYSVELENFRQKTYFKEPLSDFYNYRYLLALDNKKLIGADAEHYSITMIDFKNLRNFNMRNGYVKADEILNQVGISLFQTVKQMNEIAYPVIDSIRLVKKGADYIIFSSCPDKLLQKLMDKIKQQLNDSETNWGLESRLLNRKYKTGHTIEKALNELFMDETEDAALQIVEA